MPTTDYVALAQQLAAQSQGGGYGQPQRLNVTGNTNQQANPTYTPPNLMPNTTAARQQGGLAGHGQRQHQHLAIYLPTIQHQHLSLFLPYY